MSNEQHTHVRTAITVHIDDRYEAACMKGLGILYLGDRVSTIQAATPRAFRLLATALEDAAVDLAEHQTALHIEVVS